MATAGEQTIKEKIESLTDLPVGFTPNLASKWEVLENGLKPEKKPLVFAWRKYLSMAASLLFIGGAGLLLIKNINTKPPLANAVKQEIKLPPTNLQVAKAPIKINKKRLDNVRSKKVVSPQPVLLPQADTAAPEPVFVEQPIVPTEAIAVAEPTLAKKPKRFEEVDFNTPVIGTTVPTQTYVESQKFRFRIGFGGGTKTVSSQSKQPAVSLSTAF